MNKHDNITDLSKRRRQLGASRETMAAGLGLPVDALKNIEDGAAADQLYDQYAAWLGRIETWPEDVRARQFRIAGKGGRFVREEPQ
jgi:DNA-binding XRE family transcriptional regulator